MVSRAGWSTTPVMNPPAGQTSNFIDPSSIGHQMTLTTIICSVIFITTGVLRIYSRLFVVRSIGFDDYLCICAMVFWTGATVDYQLGVRYGMGKHLWDVSLADYSPHFMLVWITSAMVYISTMLSMKLSILMLYRRLFPLDHFATRWWLVTLFTIGYSVGGIIASICTCVPLKSAWDLTIPSTYCINTAAFDIANGVMNSISDILILALPIPIIWSLALSRGQKVRLSVLFSLGGVSCIISIIRLKSIVILLISSDNDLTYNLTGIAVWTQIEMSVGMLCASGPTLRPLVDRYFSKLWSRGGLSSKNHGNGQRFRSNIGSSEHSVEFPSDNTPNEIELKYNPKSEHIARGLRHWDTESTDQIIKHVPKGVEC